MTLLLIAIAWVAGMAAAALNVASLWPLAVAASLVATAVFAFAGRRHAALWCFPLAVIAIAGAWRFETKQAPRHPGGIAVFADSSPVTLRGVVVGDPEERGASQRIVLEVDAYRDDGGWQPTYGRVLVTTRPFPRFEYGDVVELRGDLDSAPEVEGFDYGAYLSRQGVVAVSAFPGLRRTGTDGGSEPRRILGDVRNAMGDSLTSALPEPHASLARGLLLGQRASIPRDLTDDMNRAGISHIVAISGFNVTLVAQFVVIALAWAIGRRQAILVAMAFVWVFALFVGGNGSVLRATVMSEMMLGAMLAGRPGSGLTAVAFAAAVLTAWRPVLIQDVGFQLSVAATIGIVLLSAPLQERLKPPFERISPMFGAYIAETMSVTLAASLAASPVLAATFGRVSAVALIPANVVAGLLFVPILAIAALTAVVGLFSAEAARALGPVTYLPLEALIQTGRIGASLPYASLSVEGFGLAGAIVSYVILTAFLYWLHRAPAADEECEETPSSFRLQPALGFTLALLIVAGWLAYDGWTADAAPSEVTVSVLDVGQGDATLIHTPTGLRVLIDGGPSTDRLLQALSKELPPSARRIDLVVLSDAKDEHAAGLVEVLQRYEVGAVLTTPDLGVSPSFRALRDEVDRRDLRLRTASAGQTLELGPGVQLQVVSPAANQRSTAAAPLVLRLVDHNVSFLLTGALTADGEPSLLGSGLDLESTALVLPRHGAESRWTRELIAATGPRLAVISVGPRAAGMPAPATELALRGITELRTDANGSVRLRSDGARLRVDYERGSPRQLYAPSK